ncbi:hypothetical protein MC64_012490 [Aeromonas caviae]|uniref:hypothetical protein n=1 Tax=Aeromonas TaxID=642 RepID=UPI0005369E57|nr:MULTISPECIES: hypothetical protein [Aeromonas]PNO56234.1 hypothetical protein MC64_012490 [Aeromonas caviae]QUM02995.1 hypothetical protein IMO17_08200 [Aeromonas caviae]
MASTNIEQFDLMVGKTFAYLYNRFPMPVYLSVGTLIGEDKVYVEDEFTGAELTPEAEFAYATYAWLLNAGYINGKEYFNEGIGDAVLSAKGLETLKAVPDSLQGSLGERLQEAASHHGADLVKSLASEALSFGVRLLL